MTGSPLPASFKSVYRLFWRLSSSAVLHKKSGRRYLRKLYRPFFDEGARATKGLQEQSGDTALQKRREEWLRTWNKRMDGTLSLLYSASKSRGLPHSLLYNLHYFMYSARRRVLIIERKAPQWKPDAPPPTISSPSKKQEHRRQAIEKQKQFESQGWNALAEVIRMAEGRDGLSLGRIRLRRPARKAKAPKQ